MDGSHTILADPNSIRESDALAMEQRDLQIVLILKLSCLLCDPIEGFLVAITVEGINTNTAIFVSTLVIFCPCIKCIIVNVI
jgi:hypothetical protein